MFIQEPPNQVDFSNTTGMEVICQSRGTPLPRITWVRQDGHKWVVAEDVPGFKYGHISQISGFQLWKYG